MSDTYFSWDTKPGRTDAGKVTCWGDVVRFVGTLPLGCVVAFDRSGNPVFNGWGITARILPYLEGQNQFNACNFDLDNEVPPTESIAPDRLDRIESYITHMYRSYAHAFGTDDVSFSVIAKDRLSWNRLQTLIDALRASGEPFPKWVDLHPTYSS